MPGVTGDLHGSRKTSIWKLVAAEGIEDLRQRERTAFFLWVATVRACHYLLLPSTAFPGPSPCPPTQPSPTLGYVPSKRHSLICNLKQEYYLQGVQSLRKKLRKKNYSLVTHCPAWCQTQLKNFTKHLGSYFANISAPFQNSLPIVCRPHKSSCVYPAPDLNIYQHPLHFPRPMGPSLSCRAEESVRPIWILASLNKATSA